MIFLPNAKFKLWKLGPKTVNIGRGDEILPNLVTLFVCSISLLLLSNVQPACQPDKRWTVFL